MKSVNGEKLSRLENKILRKMGRAIRAYDMLREGDRVLVAVSGGKDSYGLLHELRQLQRRAPVAFDLLAVNLDQGHPEFPVHLLDEYLKTHGYDYRIVSRDTLSVVKRVLKPGETSCSLCSRLRRGILYKLAGEYQCNVLALGHHQDDILETVLLNALYAGKIRGMSPCYQATDHPVRIIRPLCDVPESWLEELSQELQFPILPCNLCGSQPDLKRKQLKKWLGEIEAKTPGIRRTFYHALSNVDLASLPKAETGGEDWVGGA